MEKRNFLKTKMSKTVLAVGVAMTLLYFYMIALMFPIGNRPLFAILIAGEVFHVFQVLMYIFTVWDTEYESPKDESYAPHVDVFVTVAGEPTSIVEETILGCKAMKYPDFSIFILNDGFVAKKENWKDMEDLAKKLGVECITRQTPGGAKAGNINHALHFTNGRIASGSSAAGAALEDNSLVVVFDADHVPHADFLQKTVPYFVDQRMAFVQSPQFYKNYDENFVTLSAWEQQQLFFGPICKGKNRSNSVTMCGTNMVMRRDALLSVGGMSEESIAEDFLTGLSLHSRGWKSTYVGEVLAEGLAPEDFLSYYKQQFRWARGALDVFGRGFFAKKGLTWVQKLQYFSSVSFYFSGVVVLMNALIPVIYFFTGTVLLKISTMLLAVVFIPYIFLTLYILQASSNFSFTFRALTFSMGGFNIHIKAIWTALTRQKSTFSVTPKEQQYGNFVNLVIPHIVYITIVIIGIVVAVMREGMSAAFVANLAWAGLNVGVFVPFIYAALPVSLRGKDKQAARVAQQRIK